MRPKRCRFYLDIFEGDDPLGRVLGGVLEVVEAAVVEDEPPPLPVFPPEIRKRYGEPISDISCSILIDREINIYLINIY